MTIQLEKHRHSLVWAVPIILGWWSIHLTSSCFWIYQSHIGIHKRKEKKRWKQQQQASPHRRSIWVHNELGNSINNGACTVVPVKMRIQQKRRKRKKKNIYLQLQNFPTSLASNKGKKGRGGRGVRPATIWPIIIYSLTLA